MSICYQPSEEIGIDVLHTWGGECHLCSRMAPLVWRMPPLVYTSSNGLA
jgi:hypothetical protein